MPSGIPVATFAIGAAGARNAALFAAAILANEIAGGARRPGCLSRGADRGGARQARSAPALKLSRVGIVGAGQLGRMLALAGYPLGIRCSFLDRSADAPGAQVAPILVGALEDAALLAELAARSDVLTFDWENISGQGARTAREADARFARRARRSRCPRTGCTRRPCSSA